MKRLLFFGAALGGLLFSVADARASVTVTVNGSNYSIPQTNEKGWGTNVTTWIQAISANTVQPNGGTFTLTADLDFGAGFGLKSVYYKSRSSNIASSGQWRLANADSITFRNSANNADLALTPGSDGILNYNGVALDTVSLAQTLTNKTISGASNTFTNIPLSSAVTGTLPVANGGTGASLSATGGTSQVLKQTSTGGNITVGQLACSDLSNGVASCSTDATNATNISSGTLSVSRGGTGVGTLTNHGVLIGAGTSNVTQLSAAAAGTLLSGQGASSDPSFSAAPTLGASGTTGSLSLAGSSSGSITIKPQAAAGTYEFDLPITVGAAGSVLTSQGGAGTPMTWTASLTNPMTTLGDVIVGGAAGAANRLAVGTNGQYVGADSTATNGISNQEPFNDYNFLVNSGFDYWQVGTSATVTATGAGSPTATYLYQPDQWYVNNILGGGTVEGIITFSQQAASVNGSGFAAKVLITTAPTGTGIQNGAELYQVLSNRASSRLYSQTASLSIQVKAFGNVNQVGLQFYYATSEAKLTTAIGAEATCSVSTGSYTLCKISGQALGTSQTTAGVIGVRVRPTAVSSGNLYDLNNGYQVEQGMLNLGTVAHTWHRQYEDPAQELTACQFFYEKSYSLTTAPATATLVGMLFTCMAGSGTFCSGNANFKVTKRNVPTMSYWDGAGNATKYSTFSSGAWAQTNNVGALTEITPSQSGLLIRVSATNLAGGAQWVADSRM